MSIQFEHREYLLAAVAIPLAALLFYGVVRWKRGVSRAIGDERLVKELVKDYSPRRFLIRFLLVITALALLVTGLANLRQPGEKETVNRSGIDVMIALDVSKSMWAEDLKPNRLERSKQLVNKLIDRLKNDRIGLVVFAGRAYMQMPLTTDHAAARLFVNAASPASVPTQGTAIGEALRICYSAFNTSEKKYKTIILISDGEDHEEAAENVAESLADNGTLVNTIGVGSPQGATLVDKETGAVKLDNEGNTVITRLNEEGLKRIAAITRGAYLRLDQTDAAVKQIAQELGKMETKAISDKSFVNYKNYFQWLLLPALLLLLLEIFIPERKTKKA